MSAISVNSTENCCDRFFADPRVKVAYFVLEKITLLALSILAAYSCPKLFFPFFGTGIIIGTCLNWNKRIVWPCNQQTSCHKHDTHCHENNQASGGGCSQGLMEQLTGVRLPPPLGLAANVAIMADHVVGHHGHKHSNVFVPIIALNAGVWVGALLGDALPSLIEQCRAFQGPRDAIEQELDFVDAEGNLINESAP